MNNYTITRSHFASNSLGAFSIFKIVFTFVSILALAGVLAPVHAFATEASAWACALSASKTSIDEGGSSTLSWAISGATAFVIDNGVGAVASAAAGTAKVHPTVTTTYTGVATGAPGSATCSVTIMVAPTPVPAPTPTPTPTPTLAPTCTLSASASGGASATLSWSADNVASVSINNGVGAVNNSGSTSVSASQSTTYTATATAVSGASVTCSTTVTPPPPTPTPTPAPTSAPTCHISASASSSAGATLSWSATDAATVVIDNGVGTVTNSGAVAVSTSQSTTYTATATASSGASATCSTIVTTPPPAVPTCTLAANPVAIQTGSSSTLSWTTTNATSFSINNNVGAVTPVAVGIKSVSPTSNTTYTGTAVGVGGSVACVVTIGVTSTPPPPPPPPAKPVCTLTSNPSSIQTGSSSTLSWTTANATTFALDNNLGSMTAVAAGSTIVSPTANTTYNGVASGLGGTVTCPATITVTSTPPPPPPPAAPTCALSASPTSVDANGKSTLTWATTNATSFSINNSVGSVAPVAGGSTTTSAITIDTTFTGTATGPGGSVSCAAPVTITAPVVTGCTSNCGGGGGVTNIIASGSGGGGGGFRPGVVLGAIAHVGEQPLAYLYLSQIPYTGLELGTFGTILYWVALVAWALALAYLVLFGAVPLTKRSLQNFGARIKKSLNASAHDTECSVHTPTHEPAPSHAPTPEPVHNPHDVHTSAHTEAAPTSTYSPYHGFKSFAQGNTLSIDDIVKGLARSHAAPVVAREEELVRQAAEHHLEPIYEHVEPMYENVEPIISETLPETAPTAPAPMRGRDLVAALIQGDRTAVFAGLREHTRSGSTAEKLISDITFLLDDAYRARIDGTTSDAEVTRLVARLDTPTLERLIAALTTAIDSSYSTGVTGAKIALTRALTVLGA